MHTLKTLKTRNKHRGSSFEDFLKQEGLLENVQAAAFKRALALKVNDMMKEKRMNKSAMAARMRTARRGPSAARPEEHVGDTCYTKPHREIARVQGKNRIRTGLRSRETLRRAHAHVCIISGLRSIKFRTSWCRELALSRAADLGTTLHRALRVRDHS